MAAVFMASLFIGEKAVPASSQKIEVMAASELNRMISSGKGNRLLFFTAAWCGHCKAMLPTLNRLYQRFQDDGLQFTGISVDAGGPEAMARALEENRADFPVFWVGETVVDELRLVGIPMVFLVKDGQLVEKIPGKCSYRFLEKRITDLYK
jgi:thiol-disulfide isomerase/thioredoxin